MPRSKASNIGYFGGDVFVPPFLGGFFPFGYEVCASLLCLCIFGIFVPGSTNIIIIPPVSTAFCLMTFFLNMQKKEFFLLWTC